MANPTIDLILFLGLLVPFAIGAVWDIRTRRVPDPVWWLAAIPAFATHLTLAIFAGHAWQAVGLWLLAAYLFADIFLPREDLWGSEAGINWPFLVLNGLALVSVAILLGLGVQEHGWSRELLAPGMVLLAIGLGYLLYYTRLLKGGADAKAFVLIGVFFPFYPSFRALLTGVPDDPLDLWVTLPYVVVLYGALLTMVVPISTFVQNLTAGVLGPGMFTRREIPLDRVDINKHFLLDTIEDGKLVVHRRAPDIEDEEGMLRQLRDRGMKRIVVSYKVPFVVPMFLALLIAGFLAHPFMLLLGS